MCDSTESLIETLLDQFVARLRQGENPMVSEYEAAYPDLAPQIRDFFGAALMVEQIARRRQQESPHAAPPERLGDYRIVREIGRGGMGIVYEAEQESLSRRVAVKVLPPSANINSKWLRRFHREARTAARLHHTNIVPVFGVGHDHGFDYIVMQLIRGVGLDMVLRRLGRDRGVQADAEEPSQPREDSEEASNVAKVLLGDTPAARWQGVARVGVQAARALQYAHSRGTLHRDIKPANLLVDLQGAVWISDFGLAKAMEQDEVSQTGDVVGTLRYMAPERFRGQADSRSDIYGLGLTLYEMLTLRPAFEPSHASELLRRITNQSPVRPRLINQEIPRDLETIVLKAIAREPSHRYASAGELADDLERFLDDRPIHARRVGLAEQLWRWARRNRAVASLAGLAVFLLMLVVVVASVGYIRTRIANRQVREALAGESAQRKKAENISDLTLLALDDIFEQFVPSRMHESAELAVDDPSAAEIRVRAQPVLSKENVALLERMLAFYDRLAKEEGGEGRVLSKSADANRRVGDIRRRLGQIEQAEAAYQRALENHRQMAAGDKTASTTAETALIYNRLGDLYWADRRETQSRQCYEKALNLLKPMSDKSAAAQYELAQTYYFLGRGGPPDKPPGSRPAGVRNADDNQKDLQQAIDILVSLVREHPAEPSYSHLLACCYRDLPPAGTNFSTTDRAIEILQDLTNRFPDAADFRHDLSKTYAKVDLRDRPTDAVFLKTAEERLKKAVAISEELVADHPNVPDYRASHVQTLFTLSELLRLARRQDEAEKALRTALAAQSVLIEQYPQVIPYQGWRAILEESLARLLTNRGQAAEAKTILEASIASLEELVQKHPQATYLNAVLGRSYASLADLLAAQGDEQHAAEMRVRGRPHRQAKPGS